MENWIYATLLCDDLLAIPDVNSLGWRSGEAAAGEVEDAVQAKSIRGIRINFLPYLTIVKG